MTQHYSVWEFFRQTSNNLLERFFHTYSLFNEIDFKSMKESKPKELLQAWLNLPEKQRNDMDAILQDIFELGCEKGFIAIIDEAKWQMETEPEKLKCFIATLSDLPNHYDRAITTFLDYSECWKGATRFYHADTLSYWRKRKHMGNKLALYTPAWLHGKIEEIFPNIFFVTGTNKVHHDNIDLQFSRNMIIMCNEHELTLINTVRLDEDGLKDLDALGRVKNVVRIGAFHGRDDAFYLDRYQAKLWALPGMQHEHGRKTDIELIHNGPMPFPGCSLFMLEALNHPEAILHVHHEGGILISCDSLQNFISVDRFFNAETGKSFQAQGLIRPANISPVWRDACNPKASDFAKLKLLPFHHLLSAHGEPLLNTAHENLSETFKREFGLSDI